MPATIAIATRSKTRTRRLTANTIVAEICLYGNGILGCGSGFIATILDNRRNNGEANPQYGNGEPVAGYTHTQALWAACDAVRRAGYQFGKVWVYQPGGMMKAVADLNHPGYYGDLKWQAAEVYGISVERLLEAAAE